MVSSTPETEWDDEQQAWMVALAQYRSGLHSCGHPLEETTDPANEGRYAVADPTRCHACTALDIKQEQYRTVGQPAALLWRAERR